MTAPLVLAISGASGAIFALRLLEILRQTDITVHLTMSPPGALVIKQELGLEVSLDNFDVAQLFPGGHSVFQFCPATRVEAASSSIATTQQPSAGAELRYHHYTDYMAPIASGSFLTSGMIICPCSGSTVSAVVTGASKNLIHRAADVHLKERRRLVLVPRETPLSQVALDNMSRACQLGATVLPAMPGWYHGVQSARDLVDFVVSRILDQVGVEQRLIRRWGEAD